MNLNERGSPHRTCGQLQHRMGCTCDLDDFGSSKLPAAISALDAVTQERDRYREALEKIAAFGHPLEYPKADFACGKINEIAQEALNGGKA